MTTAVEASLARFLDSPGVALVDTVTGLIYGVAGDIAEADDGQESSEFAALVAERLSRAGAEGELESVITTGARRHQVLLSVGRPAGDPLLLTVGLDREQVNLALAARGMGDLVGEVLA